MKRMTLFLALLLALAAPAFAVSKEIVQLQQSVQLLSDQIRDLNRLVTERMAVMTQLVEKAADSTNKLQGSIDNMQRTLETAIRSQTVSVNQKLDSEQSRLQAVADGVDDLRARQTKLSDQLTQIRQLLETIQSQPAPQPVQPVVPVSPVPAPTPPSPMALYDNTLRDYLAGKKDLAMSGFQEYLKTYPDGDRAENCQYYIGEIYYSDGKFSKAVEAYTAVIDRYPKGNKTPAAHLRKADALIEMKAKLAAQKELNTIIRRFPKSPEASQ